MDFALWLLKNLLLLPVGFVVGLFLPHVQRPLADYRKTLTDISLLMLRSVAISLCIALVGFCASCVSAYTAYVQRQQVRAAVWPILEFDSSNAPDIHFTLAKKGVGPAIIRHVIVMVDGRPVRNWKEALEKILGPGYLASESDMSGYVFAAGESRTVFTPRDPGNNPLTFDKSNPVWVKMNKERLRITAEICYCSTLGECWTLRAGDYFCRAKVITQFFSQFLPASAEKACSKRAPSAVMSV